MGIFKTVKEAKEFISEYGGEKIKYAPCDVFDIAEALHFAKTKAISEALVRAFVQGAKYGWWEVEYRIDDFGTDEKKEAEDEARFLLERGRLGKEG